MPFFVVGISHRVATLEVREKLAIAGSEVGRVCRTLVEMESVRESLVLCTCNRVEMYGVASSEEALEDAIQSTAQQLNMVDMPYYHHTGRDALAHVLSVASSLDSMVIGEPQILGQLKEAFLLGR